MAVRNFWIHGDIDGRRSHIQGGPQAKDGGFHLTIFQRHQGVPLKVAIVDGHTDHAGNIILSISYGPDTYKTCTSDHVAWNDAGMYVKTQR